MATRIAISNLNARTIDILNTIRANASAEYQSLVPAVTVERDIPRVGEVLYGYPSLANEFVSALVNRIAAVKIKSANFNNAYAELKKGYLEFGETVEEVFVNIAKAREFSVEKAAAREFKRTLPDVRTAFHTKNWKVQYPVSIQNEDLRMAFLSFTGVEDLIAKIVNGIYVGAEYDEYLLFKYLIIKAVSHGKMYAVPFDGSDIKNAAKAFRGTSNALEFMSNKYNASGVTTVTRKEDQYIFMDAQFNADFDVDVLASAFNMEKATFMGHLKLIDDFTTFDNDRFSEIRQNSDMIEEVTATELALMARVKAVLLDKEWFQVYDNLARFTEKEIASGMYWNYFYNVWKTISSSPFSNAVVFVDDSADLDLPDNITMKVVGKTVGEYNTIITYDLSSNAATLEGRNIEWIQNEAATTAGVAVHKYGAIIYPNSTTSFRLSFKIGDVIYTATSTSADNVSVGDEKNYRRNDYVDNGLTALAITGVTLTPSFAKATNTYTGATTTGTGTLSYTAASADATVVKKFNGEVITSNSLTFTAGSENVVEVLVTGVSEGKTVTKDYKVTVTYTA